MNLYTKDEYICELYPYTQQNIVCYNVVKVFMVEREFGLKGCNE